jgi:hypothetical protein
MMMLSWILLALLLPQARPQDTPGASVDGVVVSFGSNTPIAKADVELRRINAPSNTQQLTVQSVNVILPGFGPGVVGTPAPAPSPMFSTSADGKVSFKDVPAGNYLLYVTRANGYLPGEYGQRSPAGTGTPLTLAPGQSLSNVQLSMAPTASISGRIVDGDGDPIAYARFRNHLQERPGLAAISGTSFDI